jgi:hypothetical protein
MPVWNSGLRCAIPKASNADKQMNAMWDVRSRSPLHNRTIGKVISWRRRRAIPIPGRLGGYEAGERRPGFGIVMSTDGRYESRAKSGHNGSWWHCGYLLCSSSMAAAPFCSRPYVPPVGIRRYAGRVDESWHGAAVPPGESERRRDFRGHRQRLVGQLSLGKRNRPILRRDQQPA